MKRAYEKLHRKAAVVTVWYLASYVGVLLTRGWLLGLVSCTSLAMSMAAVGFNIQHDANHNAFFDPRGSKRLTRANALAGWSLVAVGASPKRWISGHVISHHATPNVVGRDADIDLGALARLAPEQPWRPWHRYQHIYIWILYSLTAVLIILGDVTATLSEALRRDAKSPSLTTWVVLLSSKAIFFGAMLVVPMIFHPALIVALGALYVSLLTGLILAVVFQSAHVLDDAEFAKDRPTTSWHEWQVRSSLDFSHGTTVPARLLRWYIGGLDHQTEHHLFPRLPHTTYPLIAPVVSEVCAQFSLPRVVHPTLRSALRSHLRHLRAMGAPTGEVPT